MRISNIKLSIGHIDIIVFLSNSQDIKQFTNNYIIVSQPCHAKFLNNLANYPPVIWQYFVLSPFIVKYAKKAYRS